MANRSRQCSYFIFVFPIFMHSLTPQRTVFSLSYRDVAWFIAVLLECTRRLLCALYSSPLHTPTFSCLLRVKGSLVVYCRVIVFYLLDCAMYKDSGIKSFFSTTFVNPSSFRIIFLSGPLYHSNHFLTYIRPNPSHRSLACKSEPASLWTKELRRAERDT